MEAARTAEELGIRINRDVLFGSFAHLSITGYTAHPPIISVEQFPYQQGEKAVEVLIRVLDGQGEEQYYKEEIEPQLILTN